MLGIFLEIFLVNLILSGDNAVLIALVSKNLSPELKKKAIFWGTLGAVLLRILLVAVLSLVLHWPWLHALGGMLLVYIAYKLLRNDESTQTLRQAGSLGQAIKIILLADLIMSLDNVLAVAALADGHWILLVLGLITSIPMMIFCSSLMLRLMEKFKFLTYLGSGILAWTGGEMIIHDSEIWKLCQHYFPDLSAVLIWLWPLAMTVLVIAVSKRAVQDRF